MRTLTVTDPVGHVWRVRVAWQPRWRALARRFGGWRRKDRRGRDADGFEVPDLRDVGSHHTGGGGGGSPLGDDLIAIVAVVVAMAAFGVLFWWVLLPLMLVLVDAAGVVIALALAVPARVLFRRPWAVEAVSGEHRVTRHVVGWRRALAERDRMAQRLSTDQTAPFAPTTQAAGPRGAGAADC